MMSGHMCSCDIMKKRYNKTQYAALAALHVRRY